MKARTGDRDTLLAVLACGGAVAFGVWRLLVALQTGLIDTRFHEISRADKPALFWFTFAFFALVTVGLGALVIAVCVTRLFGRGSGPAER